MTTSMCLSVWQATTLHQAKIKIFPGEVLTVHTQIVGAVLGQRLKILPTQTSLWESQQQLMKSFVITTQRLS